MKVAAHRRRSAWLSLALILAGAVGAQAQLPPGTNVNIKQFNFLHQTGTVTLPQTQTLQVISEAERAFTVTTSVSSPNGGPNWLTVNGASSASGTTGQANSFISVGVVPGILTPGVYIGQVRVEPAGLPATDIPVFLRVSATAQPSLNVPAVFIQGQTGSTVSELRALTSTSAAVNFTAAPTQYQGASGWLTVSPSPGTSGVVGAPTTFTLTANLAGVPAGLHYAVVNFHSTGADPGDLSLPVILTVTQSTTVAANPQALNFTFQASNLGATTNNKVINITASPNPALAYTATITGDPRISISKTSTGAPATTLGGTTPENIYVIVNPVGIPVGPTGISASVNIATSSNTVNIPVRVTVTDSPLLIPGAESASFNYALGGSTPAAQTISLTSTIGQQSFTVTEAEVSGGDWLTVTTNAAGTPANINISVKPARLPQLAAGTYTANITILSATAGNSPLNIPVTLTVSGNAGLLNVATSSENNTLTFAADLNGQVPGTQTVSVSSTDNTNKAFTIDVDPASASSWLLLDQRTGQTGTTGTFFTVRVSPSGVPAAGRHEADIVVTAAPAAGITPVPQKVHVVFNVNATTTVTANPNRVDVTATGTTAPAPVQIQLTSAVAGITYSATTDPNVTWVTVDKPSGTLGTSTTLQLTFNTTGLAPGRHETALKISPTGATEVRIPIVLTLSSGQLNLTQTAFTVNHIQGTTAPANLTVGLTSSNTPITFAAAATSTGNWLTVEPASGTTGASGSAATPLTLRINPTGLTAGTYTGTVAVTGSFGNSPQTITVTLNVSTQAAPVIGSVLNAASNSPTFIAPGLILAIKGTNLGPATGVEATVASGAYPATLGETRVLFDGIAAPITFASAGQVNVVAPYSLFGRTVTRLQIENRGVRSETIEYRVVDASPALFTQNSQGSGQGAILNQNLSVNTSTNPAKRGDIIVLYATGEGAVRPTGADGRITTGTIDNLPRPISPVTVRINGQNVAPADIFYAGSAPGSIAGLFQLNVRISPTLNIGGLTQVPVQITVGSEASQTGVTVAVIP